MQAAIIKYNLKDDEEIKSFIKMAQVQMQSERQKEMRACTPAKEVMDAMVKRVLENGKPQYKADGTLTFDYFIECIKLTQETVLNHTRDVLSQHTEARRKCLKEKDEEGYTKILRQSTVFEQQTTNIVDAGLYQTLKVPKEVFDKSMYTYMMEPSKRTIIEEEIQAVRDRLRTRKLTELTREQCIDATRRLEKSKFEA